MVILSRLLLAAALVLVFLASWIMLPAPILPLLVLGVGAPELSAWLASGGFDGKIRIHETAKGSLVTQFIPVPIKTETVMQKASAK